MSKVYMITQGDIDNAMDAVLFGGWSDAVETCDAPASTDVRGYSLCEGCAEALEALDEFGSANLRERSGR